MNHAYIYLQFDAVSDSKKHFTAEIAIYFYVTVHDKGVRGSVSRSFPEILRKLYFEMNNTDLTNWKNSCLMR